MGALALKRWKWTSVPCYVGVNYLMKYTHSGKDPLSKTVLTLKIEIIILLKNLVIFMSDLTDLPDFRFVKKPQCW